MSFGGVDEKKLVSEMDAQTVPLLEAKVDDALAKLPAILTQAFTAALVGRKVTITIE